MSDLAGIPSVVSNSSRTIVENLVSVQSTGQFATVAGGWPAPVLQAHDGTMASVKFEGSATPGGKADFKLNKNQGVVLGHSYATNPINGGVETAFPTATTSDDSLRDIVIWAKVSAATLAARGGTVSLTVFLSHDYATGTYANYMRFDGLQVTIADEWVQLIVTVPEVSAAAAAGTYGYNRPIYNIRVACDLLAAGQFVQIGSIEIRNRPTKSIISLQADDGFDDCFTRALALLIEYKIPLTGFIITDFPQAANSEIAPAYDGDGDPSGSYTGYLSAAKLTEMVRSGYFRIGNHTKTHCNPTSGLAALTRAQQVTELSVARDYINGKSEWYSSDQAYPGGNVVVYPYSSANATTYDAAREVGVAIAFQGGFPTTERFTAFGNNRINYLDSNFFLRIPRYSVTQLQTTWQTRTNYINNYFKPYFDQQIAARRPMAIVFHTILPDGITAPRSAVASSIQVEMLAFRDILALIAAQVAAGTAEVIFAHEWIKKAPKLRYKPDGTEYLG